jgi:hypothetical protein
MKSVVVASIILGLSLAACGGTDSGGAAADAAVIALSDASLPDASPPDAAPCAGAVCNGVCIDTQKDPLNCGACGQSCGTPARQCLGGSCTACPDFLPDDLRISFTFAGGQMGTLFAIGGFTGADRGNHAVIIIGVPDAVETGVDLDLSAPLPLNLLIGYRVDPGSMMVQTTYAAASGTINVSQICAGGVVATVTNASFVESDFQGNPIAGGCTLEGLSTTLELGDPCVDEIDAGTM